MIAPATPRPMRSTRTSGNSGAVSHSVCVRSPTASAGDERAEHNHPAGRRQRRPAHPPVAAGVGRLPPPAVSRHACAASASASPGRSLMGRTASVPRQRRGQRQRRGRQGSGVERGTMAASRPGTAASADEHTIEQERRRQCRQAATAATARVPRSPTPTPARGERADDGGHHFAERRCRRDSREDAGDARRRRSRGRPSAKFTESMSSSDVATNGTCARPTTSASAASARVGVTIRVAGAAPR